ncbi:hypothetical protein T459_23105 [Capsicum annuum]|uniref:ribose-5-phosphate isomerase n=1 Tax=Capsicum annuum TaxID=4072 RepID=A0A2G2YRF1_CAPAN|nr:hypothetical protein T459_23105 [Capsicum annuum]
MPSLVTSQRVDSSPHHTTRSHESYPRYVATFSGDILFEQDRLLMPIFDEHHSKYRDLVRQQEDYESIHRDLMIGLGTCEFDLMELETLSLTVKAPLTFGKLIVSVTHSPSGTGTGSTTTFVVANSTLDDHPHIDLAINGDEVDPNFDFVKGRSGALLREKMVEAALEKFVLVVDDSKLVSVSGGSGLAMLVEMVQTLIKDFATAGKEIVAFEGVVEHGLFLDMTTVVIIAVIIAGKEGVSVKSKGNFKFFALTWYKFSMPIQIQTVADSSQQDDESSYFGYFS